MTCAMRERREGRLSFGSGRVVDDNTLISITLRPTPLALRSMVDNKVGDTSAESQIVMCAPKLLPSLKPDDHEVAVPTGMPCWWH
jgi:hypothetical protein